VRDPGLTWRHVIPASSLSAPETMTQAPGTIGWRDAATIALRSGGSLLSDWERDFLQSVLRGHRCSPKQSAIITRIHDRLVAAGVVS
jgi:hypothetical protein